MKVEDIERKGRLSYLDNLGGILILYMIFLFHLPGHCGIGSSTSIIICRNFFDFFMAWFFFKAGMVFKDRPTKDVARSSFRRLLVPYFAFSLIGIAIMGLQQWQWGGASFFLCIEE